jgi:Family of unknown function (DUF6352)
MAHDMTDFWLTSGYHLLDRATGGGLVVTDAFLEAYFRRPELNPPPQACSVERALHAALLADPRCRIDPHAIERIADADARENFELMIAFRDRLMRHPTLEAAYAALIHQGVGRTPPLFLNQLVHVIMRNALDGCSDPFVLRAAELMFRPQRLTSHQGSLIAVDEALIADAERAPVSPLVAMMGLSVEGVDVLGEDNAAIYFERSERFDMALDLTAGRRGHSALGEAIARFVRHMLSLEVAVEPLVQIRDVQFIWYVGLDADGTRIGDLLWKGGALDEATAERIIALFRLTFLDEAVAAVELAGEPVYLILAMAPDRVLRMKPQNLMVGLPIRHLEAVS